MNKIDVILAALNENIRNTESMNTQLADLRKQLADTFIAHAYTIHELNTLQTELIATKDALAEANTQAEEQEQALAALQQQLTEERALHAMKSQARNNQQLQRVTPETMAEVEAKKSAVIAILSHTFHDSFFIRFWSTNKKWHVIRNGYIATIDRPTRGWFIDITTLPD